MAEEQTTRSPRTIARLALKDAKDRGVIKDFSIRGEGRATVYSAKGAYKTYTDSALDTLDVIARAERGEW